MPWLIRYGGSVVYNSRSESMQATDVTLDIALNEAGTLRFTVAQTNPMWGRIARMDRDHEVTAEWDGLELFRGRVREIEETWDGCLAYTCEGERAYLNDVHVEPHTCGDLGGAPSDADGYFSWLVEAYNARSAYRDRIEVGEVHGPGGEVSYSRTDRTMVWDDLRELVEDVGGYVRVRHDRGLRLIDWVAEADAVCSQRVVFGRNVTDLHRSLTVGETWSTRVVPVGKTVEVTDPDTEEVLVEGGLDVLITDLPDGPLTAGYAKLGDAVVNVGAEGACGVVERVLDLPDVSDPQTLQGMALDELTRASMGDTIEVTAVDMRLLDASADRILPGALVRVTSPHDVDEWMLCREASISADQPDTSRYTLGSTEASLAKMLGTGTTVSQVSDEDAMAVALAAQASATSAGLAAMAAREAADGAATTASAASTAAAQASADALAASNLASQAGTNAAQALLDAATAQGTATNAGLAALAAQNAADAAQGTATGAASAASAAQTAASGAVTTANAASSAAAGAQAAADLARQLSGYGPCWNGVNTVNKTVTLTPAVSDFELRTGCVVAVNFSNGNNVATPTLNVNSTGAKEIRGPSGEAFDNASMGWSAGQVVSFVYNGTYWLIVNSNALTKAFEATKVATNYLGWTDGEGLTVGDMTAGTLGSNALVAADGFHVRNGTTELANFKATSAHIGIGANSGGVGLLGTAGVPLGSMTGVVQGNAVVLTTTSPHINNAATNLWQASLSPAAGRIATLRLGDSSVTGYDHIQAEVIGSSYDVGMTIQSTGTNFFGGQVSGITHAITTRCSSQKTLSATTQLLTLGTKMAGVNDSGYLAIQSGGVKCAKAGTVLVSANCYFQGQGGMTGKVFAAYVCVGSTSTVKASSVSSSGGAWGFASSIAPFLMTVTANQVIYLAAQDQDGGGSRVPADVSTNLTVMYVS